MREIIFDKYGTPVHYPSAGEYTMVYIGNNDDWMAYIVIEPGTKPAQTSITRVKAWLKRGRKNARA